MEQNAGPSTDDSSGEEEQDYSEKRPIRAHKII